MSGLSRYAYNDWISTVVIDVREIYRSFLPVCSSFGGGAR